MKVFIIGVGGGTGGLLADKLIANGHEVGGLARQQGQVNSLAQRGIQATLGDLVAMSEQKLSEAMAGSDVLVFSAGAGGKDGAEATTEIDGKGPGKAAAAAKSAGVDRMVLVSVFPEAWRDRHASADFEHYIVEKKRAEVELVMRDIDWVIVRPAELTDGHGTGMVSLSPAEVHTSISRSDVAATIAQLIDQPAIRKVILELASGSTAIFSAVDRLAAQ